MNPAYMQRVVTQQFFAPSGVFPPVEISLLVKPISCDVIHTKQFSAHMDPNEMDAFFQQLYEKYGDFQVIKVLSVDNTVLLVYAVPRCRMRDLPSVCGPAAEGV